MGVEEQDDKVDRTGEFTLLGVELGHIDAARTNDDQCMQISKICRCTSYA